jgi:hypothetical protein
MISESSEPDEQFEQVALHREMDRLLEAWDEEPTHEKWRRGVRWK